MQLYKIGVEKETHYMHFKVACDLFFEGLTGAFLLPRWPPFKQHVTYQLHVDQTSYLTKSKFCTISEPTFLYVSIRSVRKILSKCNINLLSQLWAIFFHS